MAIDYKLCPKCNNALDKKETKCPYCGEMIGFSFSVGDNPVAEHKVISNKSTTKKTGGCVTLIIVFIVIQIIGAIISFISEIISSIF